MGASMLCTNSSVYICIHNSIYYIFIHTHIHGGVEDKEAPWVPVCLDLLHGSWDASGRASGGVSTGTTGVCHVYCSVLQYIAVCCSALQCVAVCCSV